MKKILVGCLIASSVVLAKPYIENYNGMMFTKEQTKNVIPKITAYKLDDAVKTVNDYLQTNNINLKFTTREMKNIKTKKFDFKGGSLESFINYLNSRNIYVEKLDDVLFLKNSGDTKYEVGLYHTKKEIVELKKEITSRAKAVSISEDEFFGKNFFVVNASPYGHKIAKKILDKDVKDQLTKSKRLKIEFTKGDTKILVAGIRLSKPMTVQRFFKELGGQNLKSYIVKGNANIPMNENIVVHNSRDLSNYLRVATGTRLKAHRDGKLTIVEVLEK